ncbi:MAG: response regulator [Bacteriovoracaceae bacterium]|jgi:CheY-like chemotaxis protein|nr:response regulator [Bacteriovoracaceae bacterium]
MKKVLIVEDMLSIQKLLKTILESRDYKVICTNNGKEALKVLEQENFDLILLDIMMPIMSGVEFLKNFSHNDKTKICMLTAKEENDSIKECMDLGASDYVLKPIDKSILLEKVKCLVNDRNAVRIPSIKLYENIEIHSDKDNFIGKLLYLFEDKIILEMEGDFENGQIVYINTETLKKKIGFELDVVCKITAKHESEDLNGYVAHFYGFQKDKARKIRSYAISPPQ